MEPKILEWIEEGPRLNEKIIYVTSTAILVLEVLAGAFMDLAQLPLVVQAVRSIGYPTYVLYIVGVI